MERFGSEGAEPPRAEGALGKGPSVALTGRAFFGKLFALSLAAICYGLINFGLLLWLPADLVAKGYSMDVEQAARESALIAFPTVFIVAYLYSRWSTKWSVVGSIAVTLAGLAGRPVAGVHRQRQPGPSGGAADRRHQRADRDAASLCGGELPAPYPRPDHRHGRGLHQGGRHVRPVAGDPGACPAARRRVADHHRANDRGARPRRRFGKETRGRDLRDLDPTATPSRRPGLVQRDRLSLSPHRSCGTEAK